MIGDPISKKKDGFLQHSASQQAELYFALLSFVMRLSISEETSAPQILCILLLISKTRTLIFCYFILWPESSIRVIRSIFDFLM